jgi:hypothetical protein
VNTLVEWLAFCLGEGSLWGLAGVASFCLLAFGLCVLLKKEFLED